MNSFHDSVNAKMPAEINPGTESGRMIFHRIWKRVAPSIKAHSSSSYGMVRKYPINSQVQNGIRKVGYVRISAQRVSNRPSWNTRWASGMNRIEGGTRYARKMLRPTWRAPWKRSRSMAYAASTAAASDAKVDTTETRIVFQSQSG